MVVREVETGPPQRPDTAGHTSGTGRRQRKGETPPRNLFSLFTSSR